MINGIFSDTLKNLAHWFLYIFIDASANLGTAIMTKRRNQLYWLKLLADWNFEYNFNELVEFVRQGIYERYGMQPAQVLEKIYNAAISTQKNIGSSLDPTDGLTDQQIQSTIDNADTIALTSFEITNPQTQTKTNFWNDLAKAIEWLVDLINKLGQNDKSKSIATNTPAPSDWSKLNNTTTAGIGDYLPYVAAAGIIYYLFTNKSN